YRVASAVPDIKIGDVRYNCESIRNLCAVAKDKEVDAIVFPELCITGYTCGDLFEQPLLMRAAEKEVMNIAKATARDLILVVVGAPVMAFGRRYNCAIALYEGEVLAIVPKSHIPNYNEFYEKRWFESGEGIKNTEIPFAGGMVPFGTDIILQVAEAKIGMEICEDLWTPVPPSSRLAMAGAEIIFNLSASDELIGKHDYLLKLISQQSARCRCAYIYSSAGWGESSTDLVFAGNAIISEDGVVLDSKRRFFTEPMLQIKDVDIEKLRNDRAKYNTFFDDAFKDGSYRLIKSERDEIVRYDERGMEKEKLVKKKEIINIFVDPHPFVPHDEDKLREHCEEIINIQARGLMQRLNVINCKKAVIGISGGLDSTLALLVTVRAFDKLGLDRKGIIGITMPGMATTSRTRSNAVALMEELGVTALEIPIGKAVAQHFSDIGQNPEEFDTTYENSQARERTQILMDYSNKENAIVIGTGDMSELALGWCTYNGDHISMYGVNASIPKTLVRHLVSWFATEVGERAAAVLRDIVDTPISPELVPSGTDEISQKTEDLVGPYELHDFFMYHLLRNSFSPAKINYLANIAYKGRYDSATILKWLENFYRRFFSQQFKRSCMPDGPKVGSVCLSPRGDWRMPSDASSRLWMNEIEEIKKKYGESASGKPV
ncbi:MAG: NAD(+) synthase, partial [Muribaculaceae bacterium]|nr:NAD(+) synthase [Muribaculaceae bacterium]